MAPHRRFFFLALGLWPKATLESTSMKTKAAVAWRAGAPLSIETVELAGPRAGEVLVVVVY